MPERWSPKNPRGAPPVIRQVARDLRSTMTDAEQLLWNSLRNRQLEGVKFRRQHPVGRFILDFYASQHHLAIELDGRHHDNQTAQDADRTHHLESHGYSVLRFNNEEILINLPGVLNQSVRQ